MSARPSYLFAACSPWCGVLRGFIFLSSAKWLSPYYGRLIGQAIIFCRCGFFFFSFFFFPSPILKGRIRMSTTLPHVRIYNSGLKCVVRGSLRKQAQKNSPSAHHKIGNKMLNSNISFTCPRNIVNFGPLMAEIGWRVWGTPENFNGFRVLASLLHRRRSTAANQTLHGLCPSPGLSGTLLCTFSGALAP